MDSHWPFSQIFEEDVCQVAMGIIYKFIARGRLSKNLGTSFIARVVQLKDFRLVS